MAHFTIPFLTSEWKHTVQGISWLKCFLRLIMECGREVYKFFQVAGNSRCSRKCPTNTKMKSQTSSFLLSSKYYMLPMEGITLKTLTVHHPRPRRNVSIKRLTTSDTYLKWDEVWFPSGRHSAMSPKTATAWCAPGLAAPSSCALWFWPFGLLSPFSKLSWHTAFQNRGHLFYELEILFHKLQMKK